MTAPATTRRAGPFNGNASATRFPFAFKVFSKDDVQVELTDTGAVTSTLVQDSDYSVSVNADQDATPGGTITYPITGAPLAAGKKLVALGATKYDQPTDLPEGGAYRAKVVENALDRAVFLIQQLQELAARSLTLPASAATANTTLPAPKADQLIGWNTAATALVNLDPTALATIVAFGTANADTFTGDGTTVNFTLTANPGALANLDVSVGGVTQLPVIDYTWSGTTLTFTTAPPNTVKALARYFQALPQGTTDSGASAFTRTGAYAAGTVGASLQTWFNVKDAPFNAKGDGVTDDTAAIQAAIVAAKVGGVVYLPGGKYKITSTLTLYAGVTLQGASGVATAFGVHTYTKNPTRLWQATAATPHVLVTGTASVDTVCDWNIFDICFAGVSAPAYNDAPQAGKYGVHCRGTAPYSAYRSSIERCTFFSLEDGIRVEGYDTGAGIDWQLDNVLIQRNAFFQCQNGVNLNTINADAWLIQMNVFAVPPNGKSVYCQRSGYCVAASNYAVPGYATNGTLATGTEMFRMGAYPDNFKMIGNAGGDGLAYFFRVDTSTGYENNELIYDLDSNIIEADCLAERRCKILSRGNRSTHDFLCPGDDVEVRSYGDSWNPTTKGFKMTGLRPRLFVDPGSTQTSGATTAATGTATTIVTLPASAGAYQFYAWLTAGGSIYKSLAFLGCDGTNLDVLQAFNGANLSITRSGRNVQITQTSGVSQSINWTYNRIG